MAEIFKLFYQILWFKKAPQDVPFSLAVTLISLLTYAAVNFLLLFMSTDSVGTLLQVFTKIVFMMIFLAIALFWAGKLSRYQQTFCALLGTDAIVSFLEIPATAPLLIPSGSVAILGFVLVVIFMLWHWVVAGHIFRHALSEEFSFGLGVAFLYLLLAYLLLGFLFPETVTNVSSE